MKPLLGWHGARLNFLALFLIALLRVKTVNLAELATGFPSQAKTESSYKRLQRFFRNFDLDYAVIAKIIHIFCNPCKITSMLVYEVIAGCSAAW